MDEDYHRMIKGVTTLNDSSSLEPTDISNNLGLNSSLNQTENGNIMQNILSIDKNINVFFSKEKITFVLK